MGLDEVVEDILAAGKARAGALLKEAATERERLLAEARERTRILRMARIKQAERAAAQTRVRELAAAELEVKRARLAMERDLMEAVSTRARERITALQPWEDEALLTALLATGECKGFRIFSAKKNEAFLRASSPLEYAGNIRCLGGLVLESPDGSVRMDYTYDTILREAADRMMRQLFGILFSR